MQHLQRSLWMFFCSKHVTDVVLTWCPASCSFVFLLLSGDGSLQQKRLWMCAQRLKSTTVCLFIHCWMGDGFDLKAGNSFWKWTYWNLKFNLLVHCKNILQSTDLFICGIDNLIFFIIVNVSKLWGSLFCLSQTRVQLISFNKRLTSCFSCFLSRGGHKDPGVFQDFCDSGGTAIQKLWYIYANI